MFGARRFSKDFDAAAPRAAFVRRYDRERKPIPPHSEVAGILSPHLHRRTLSIVVLLATSNQAAITTVKVLHIVAASYFGLGVLLAMIFTLQVPNTPKLTHKARVMANGARVALAMIVPGSLIAGVLGFILANLEGFSIHNKWILISTVLFFVALILGGVSGPINARLRRRVESEARSGKKPSAELLQALRSPVPLIMSFVSLALAIALVVLMFVQRPA
jgi:uncharacterized membrane protein